MKRYSHVLILAAALLVSCRSVTIKPGGGDKLKTSPSFEQTQHFFLWGLAPGAQYVSLKKACKKKRPVQMQTIDTFGNGFLSAITFGIYSPRTARVWCK